MVDTVVNQVGVNVNTASPAFYHVAGLNKTISENIVKYREENGALTSRQQLKRCLVWVTRPLSRQLVSCEFLMRLIFGQYWRESYKAVENLLELLAIDHLDEAAQEKLKQVAIADTAEKSVSVRKP